LQPPGNKNNPPQNITKTGAANKNRPFAKKRYAVLHLDWKHIASLLGFSVDGKNLPTVYHISATRQSGSAVAQETLITRCVFAIEHPNPNVKSPT
jgi:hypothetical protein